MDLSNLRDTFVRARETQAPAGFESEEVPWRANELEAFRSFLINSKRRWLGPTSDARNLCIIRGQTGSGKVTTIRRLCAALRINVLEYDPFNLVANTNKQFDYHIDHLIRFLQNSVSRRSLRAEAQPRPAPASGTLNENLTLGLRRVKRIRSSTSGILGSGSVTGPDSSIPGGDTQLVLICDFPRGVLNCRYTLLYPIHNLLKEVISSNNAYPLVIVTTNSSEDYLILRRILPTNFQKDPRCLVINLKEITKTKALSILRTGRKSKLLDYLIDISSGDIRYILNNFRFYSLCNEAGRDGIDDYLLERNNLNNFKLLGKILFNKRVPVVLLCNSNNIEHRSQGGLEGAGPPPTNINPSEDRDTDIGEHIKPERPSRDKAADLHSGMESDPDIDMPLQVPDNNGIDRKIGTKRVVEDADESFVRAVLSTFGRCFALSKPVVNKPCQDPLRLTTPDNSPKETQERAESTQDRLKAIVNRVPVAVRIYGLSEEFDPERPLSHTRWPRLEPEPDSTHFRHNPSKMLPKLTRPLLYYKPDDLIDSIKSDPNFFANSVFDNYSDLFGHVDDCARFARSCTTADVFYTSHRNFSDLEVSRHFLSICIRAALDSNIHGFDSTARGFHQFRMHANLRTRLDQIRSMFHDFNVELSRIGRPPYSRDIVFQEIMPTFLLSTSEKESVGCEPSQVPSEEDEYSIMDVMDQVEQMLEEREERTNQVKEEAEKSIFVPKFNEIMHELSKLYYTHPER